jgi:hypothetical protein
MNKTSTELDIIKYIYNELNQEEKAQIDYQTIISSKTLELMCGFKDVKNSLDNIVLLPKDSIINNIKNFSKSFNLTEHDFVK